MGEGRGGVDSEVFCSPYALLYRKIPKCPKTFGHDCLNVISS